MCMSVFVMYSHSEVRHMDNTKCATNLCCFQVMYNSDLLPASGACLRIDVGFYISIMVGLYQGSYTVSVSSGFYHQFDGSSYDLSTECQAWPFILSGSHFPHGGSLPLGKSPDVSTKHLPGINASMPCACGYGYIYIYIHVLVEIQRAYRYLHCVITRRFCLGGMSG